MPPSTLPAYWKIYRTGIHFKELEAELLRYFQGNPGKLVIQPESAPDAILASFQAKDRTPARIPLIIGDCLQNTRSALDYLVWELVRANGHEPGKHNMFPICPSSESFKEALKFHGKRPGVLEGIHVDAIPLISGLQPYTEGDNWEQQSLLWILDQFVNINKHRRVLITDLVAAPVGDIRVVDIDGELWAHGTLPSAEENAQFGPFIAKDGKVNMDSNLVAFIRFNEAPAKGQEVGTLLSGILRYVHLHIIPQFERFFS